MKEITEVTDRQTDGQYDTLSDPVGVKNSFHFPKQNNKIVRAPSLFSVLEHRLWGSTHIGNWGW